jgi:DivIVA domain-containing protein
MRNPSTPLISEWRYASVGARHNSVTAAIDALEIDYRPNDFARNRTPRRAAENAEDVYRIQFSSPPAGNHGYRMDKVDAFLDVVAARLKMRNHLTLDEVREGYDTHEVDSFLDEVEATLAGNRRTTPRQRSLVAALCVIASGVIALLQMRHTHQGGRALAVPAS